MSERRRPSSLQVAATLAVVAAAILAAAIYVDRTVGGPAQASPSPSAPAVACGSVSGALPPLPGDAGKRTYTAPPPMGIDTTHKYLATIQTAKGGVITLVLDPALAPITVNNFVFLARNCFYDGLKFHRVVANFVIQGGDPQGTGSGGPGYQFNDEPVKGDYTDGCVAMANSGTNTNGSQFFICIANNTTLPKKYNLFGYVQSGLDVAKKIQKGDVMTSVTVQQL